MVKKEETETKLEDKTRAQLLIIAKEYDIHATTKTTKSVLLEKVGAFEELIKQPKTNLSQKCKEYELPYSGTKTELSKRIIEHEEYSKETKPDLKEWCRTLELPVSGTKMELIKRIKDHQNNKRTQKPFKGKSKKKIVKSNSSSPKSKPKVSATNSPKAEKKIKITKLPEREPEIETVEESKPEMKKQKKNSKTKIFKNLGTKIIDKVGRKKQIIRIASWNIANLSSKSRHKKWDILAEYINQFDVLAVQEVMDEKVLEILQEHLGDEWSFIASGSKVGRVRKEFYAFLWRNSIISLKADGLFSDPQDKLEREPFVATFKAKKFDFTLVTIHVLWGGTSPSKRRHELLEMKDVISNVLQNNGTEKDVILLGDFNFGPNDPGWQTFKDMGFIALIEPPETTTVGNKLYDNIWINPEHTGHEYDSLCGVIPFDKDLYPYNTLLARNEISDHRPIWAQFRGDLDDDEDDYGDLSRLSLEDKKDD